jgi:CDP-paratose 2-epimerase
MPKRLLVTGSSGLIGSEVCLHFARKGWEIHGVDNNQRAVFFGPAGDTRWNQARLSSEITSYQHHEVDIRDRPAVLQLLKTVRPDAIVHTAAQPSHDRAAAIPFDDFDTNAVGTFNLLEATRQSSPEAPFVHMSTNKVYGDRPNTIKLRELETRWDYDDPQYVEGIAEDFSIDQSKHSLFGASKVAADIVVQEYGRYFNMPTACLRGGCLTGPSHSGVELHGFLSYLVKCNLQGNEYRVFGYKGKQVRDNIHSNDLVNCFWEFYQNPKAGAVYNIGGSRHSNCSVLEAIEIAEEFAGKKLSYSLSEQNREGDHIWWISDVRKFQNDFPDWKYEHNLQSILKEIVEATQEKYNSETKKFAVAA